VIAHLIAVVLALACGAILWEIFYEYRDRH
jgi:hypothetical protein